MPAAAAHDADARSVAAVTALYKGGMHISDIAKHEGISRTTVYKIIGEQEELES